MKPLLLAAVAYAVPTFAIAFLWHLHLFAGVYEDLAIYREDLIVPFGGVAVLAQGILFAWLLEPREPRATLIGSALRIGVAAGLLSWTFTTLAVAAKFPMRSVSTYLITETAFTIVQFLAVAPLMAWAYRTGRATAS